MVGYQAIVARNSQKIADPGVFDRWRGIRYDQGVLVWSVHDERMRHVFAHQSILFMDRDADLRVPGAAITVGLCGHWDHEPPCPLAAHHTRTEWLDDRVRVRTLFATETDNEQIVRQHIGNALSAGQFQGPDGSLTRWRLLTSERSQVQSEEREHGARLAHS